MAGQDVRGDGLNARLGKNLKNKKSRRLGKNLRRALAGLTLVGSVVTLAAAVYFGR